MKLEVLHASMPFSASFCHLVCIKDKLRERDPQHPDEIRSVDWTHTGRRGQQQGHRGDGAQPAGWWRI